MTQKQQQPQKKHKPKKPIVRENPYIILRVDRIPVRITFKKLLAKVYPFSRQIIGIYRIADYISKQVGQTVYFICTSASDATFLEKQWIDFVEDGRDSQALRVVESVVGFAALNDRLGSLRYERVPVSVHLKGLAKLYDAPEGYTDYLESIVPYFENQGRITGIRLGYDQPRKCTRRDGFVTYINQADARAIAGESEPIKHKIHGEIIEATLGLNVPAIVRKIDADRLHNGRAVWAPGLEEVNQLITTIKPFVPAIVHPQSCKNCNLQEIPQPLPQATRYASSYKLINKSTNDQPIQKMKSCNNIPSTSDGNVDPIPSTSTGITHASSSTNRQVITAPGVKSSSNKVSIEALRSWFAKPSFPPLPKSSGKTGKVKPQYSAAMISQQAQAMEADKTAIRGTYSSSSSSSDKSLGVKAGKASRVTKAKTRSSDRIKSNAKKTAPEVSTSETSSQKESDSRASDDNLSVKAVHGLKGATTGQFGLEYNVVDEELIGSTEGDMEVDPDSDDDKLVIDENYEME